MNAAVRHCTRTRCGQPLAADKRPDALYCTARCRDAARAERVRAAQAAPAPPVLRCTSCGAGPLQPQRSGAPRGSQRIGRGLCGPCWAACSTDGTLLDFPRKTWPAAELAAEAEFVRRRDPELTWREVADVLGVRYTTLDRARVRARARRAA